MRTLLGLLLAVLIVSALTGCGAEKDKGKNKDLDKPQSQKEG
jgi:hypothetical protein